MDSLIVLRKPLKKPQSGAKYTVPRKSRKFPAKVEPIPTEPGLSEPQYAGGVCFSRLWQARRSPARAAPHPSPALSSTSLLPQYHAPAAQPRAELVLELDYATSVQHSTAY